MIYDIINVSIVEYFKQSIEFFDENGFLKIFSTVRGDSVCFCIQHALNRNSIAVRKRIH